MPRRCVPADDLLLLHVADAAVEDPGLLGLQLERRGEPLLEPGQGADPLGEDDDAVLAGAADADLLEVVDEAVVLGAAFLDVALGEVAQDLEGFRFLCRRRAVGIEPLESFGDAGG